MSPGFTCGVSRRIVAPQAPKGSFVPRGIGEGPVYLTGQFDPVWYSDGLAQLVVDPAYSDIVLIRGKQLNGPQGMPLAAAPAGSSADIEIPAVHPSNERVWNGRISVIGPGCFGLQVDGATFEEGIVFEVVPGTSPVPAGP